MVKSSAKSEVGEMRGKVVNWLIESVTKNEMGEVGRKVVN